MRSILRTASLCGLLVSASLEAQSNLPAGTWRIADAPAELHDYVSRADLIVVSMQSALQRELTEALGRGGPGFAIKSCHIDVVGMAQRIGRQPGLTAGRTSDRLRNTSNAPRQWAAPLVQANAGRYAREIDGYAVDLGDAVGVLRPIAHRPLCNACHGPAKRLDPVVRGALTERYPADRATGFEDGEIRGWFWVELPKKPR